MLRHPQVLVPMGGMLRAMPKVKLPPLGSSLQVVGALVTLVALIAAVGVVVTGLIVGPLMLVAGVFVESPVLLTKLGQGLQRRPRPAGGS